MGDPWGIGDLRAQGDKPNIKQIVKKNRWKNPKSEKSDFFFLLKMV